MAKIRFRQLVNYTRREKMQFEGAIVKEQGITFGIAVVKPSVLQSSDRDDVKNGFAVFFGVPTVIMAQDSRGVPRYYGRQDIVNFLSNVPPQCIPWRRYTIQ
jgi:hypothetical protein